MTHFCLVYFFDSFKKSVQGTLLIIIVYSLFNSSSAYSTSPAKILWTNGEKSSSGSSFTMTWSTPTERSDGQNITPGEIVNYIIYRRPQISWTTNQTNVLPVSQGTSLKDSGLRNRTMFYNVVAVNNLGESSESSNFIFSEGEIVIMMDDSISYIQAPVDVVNGLRNNGFELRGTNNSSDEGGNIFKSVTVDAFNQATGQSAGNQLFDQPVQVSVGYLVDSQGIVSSGSPDYAFARALPTSEEAQMALSTFWFNGAHWIKIQSSVDTDNKVATLRSRHPGNFQVRLALQNLEAELNSTYPQTITPNEDGINDHVFFLFENPAGGSVQGKLYDAQSAFVADAKTRDLFTGDTVLSWDGKDTEGSVVTGGIYYYKLEAGGKTFTGTVAVAR